MSFTMVIMFSDGIHAITDKRMGIGSSLNGEIVNWKFGDDNQTKISKIADNIYLTGGLIVDIGDRLMNHLKECSPVGSEIVKQAASFDRLITPAFGKHTHDPAIIFGLYDNGKPFIWKGERDGTSDIIFPGKNPIMEISGGLNDTLKKSLVHFQSLIEGPNKDFVGAMKSTLKYAASIDKVISDTYDFLTICGITSKSHEAFSTPPRKILTSENGGERIEVLSGDNSLTAYNSANDILFQIKGGNAFFKGSIEAAAGKIGNFYIDGTGLKNTDNVDAYIIQEKTLNGSVIARAAIGTNTTSGDNRVGDFKNVVNVGVPNYGLSVVVRNGSRVGLSAEYTGNFAAMFSGDVVIDSGHLIVNDHTYFNGPIHTGGWGGLTNNVQFSRGGGQWTLQVVNGICVNIVNAWI